jgi:hypothetical protein
MKYRMSNKGVDAVWIKSVADLKLVLTIGAIPNTMAPSIPLA